MAVSDIEPIDVQNWQLKLSKKCKSSYVRAVQGLFSVAMDRAIVLGITTTNPSKIIGNVKKQKSKIEFWTKEEFEKVISLIYKEDYYQHFLFISLWFLFMTGMRIGEATAIQWEDIDFERKWIHVHSTIEKDKNGVWYAKQQTKTVAGNRKIDLDDFTITILKKWREVQIKNDDKDYVVSRFGAPLCKSTISRIIKRHAKITGVPEITGKGLRHSHASYLINVLHKDTLYVSYRLGHADKSTTLNTYSHWYYSGDSTISEEITNSLDNLGLSIYLPNSCQS